MYNLSLLNFDEYQLVKKSGHKRVFELTINYGKMETILKEKGMQLSDNTKRVVVDVIGYLFIALFIYAAVNKLFDYDKFKAQMGQSPMLVNYVGFLAWAVPLIELLIAVLLFIHRTVLNGLYASFSLMLLFTVYITVILVSGERVPCSCGGILEHMSWVQHLVFNAVFVVLGILGILFKRKLDKSE